MTHLIKTEKIKPTVIIRFEKFKFKNNMKQFRRNQSVRPLHIKICEIDRSVILSLPVINKLNRLFTLQTNRCQISLTNSTVKVYHF